MGSLYGCSSFSIAVTSARDGNMGCFFERKASAIRGIPICVNNKKLYDLALQSVYNVLRNVSYLTKHRFFRSASLLSERCNSLVPKYFGSAAKSKHARYSNMGHPKYSLRDTYRRNLICLYSIFGTVASVGTLGAN
jgi:hypothetical protein